MANRSPSETSQIDRFLGSNGFPPLKSGTGLLAALGYMIRDHEHLRSLIGRCPAEDRVNMYDSLHGYLRFVPKPLDVYVSETKQLAERMEYPTIAADGSIQPFRQPEISTDESTEGIDTAALGLAIGREVMKFHLILTCKKCTVQADFHGMTKHQCVQAARDAGWTYWVREDNTTGEVCPTCPVGSIGNITPHERSHRPS